MTTRLSPAAYLDHLRSDGGRLSEVGHAIDLSSPVPSCPKCGADQRDAPVAKPTSARAARAAAAKQPEEAEAPSTEDEEAEAEDEEDDED